MSATSGLMEWSISRGRSYELDKTEGGTATMKLADVDGSYDPSNPSSPLYGNLDPMQQAALTLKNPVNSLLSTLFQGYVSDLTYDLDVSENFAIVTVELVDAFSIFAGMNMHPARFGDTAPAGSGISAGDIYFDGAGGWYGGTADHWGPGQNSYHIGRINRILNQAGWPAGKRQIFSGNVALQDTVYPNGTSVLTALQDTADAEFPGVANLFISRDGKVYFRGRFARFSPANYALYGIKEWYCGDATYADANPSTYAPISNLVFDRGMNQLINAVMCTPQGISDTDWGVAEVKDDTSITTYGYHSETFSDLLVYKGEALPRNTAAEECKLFAQYYVDNYAYPRNRVSQIELRTKQPDHPNALALWNLICGVELGDVVHLKTNHPSAGGFDEGFFVEGIKYDAKPMNADYPEITLTLEVSPTAYFTTSPF